MTNTDIIISEAVANGLYTMEQIENILASGHMIPLHTFQAWKSYGYSVKKGEHARITTRLWRFTNKAKKNEDVDENTDGTDNNHYYLAKAFLFYRRPSREIEIKNNPQGIEPRGRFSSCGILFYKPVL